MPPARCDDAPYVLGEIIVLTQRHGHLETRNNEHSLAVYQAMRVLGGTPNLQLRIMMFFTYERIHRSGRAFDTLFEHLSPQLRFELQFFLYADIVGNTALFRKSRPRVIREIVVKLGDMIFLPGDWVCRYGEYGDSMYFVVNGHCAVLASDASTQLSTLQRGAYFGEIALLTRVPRTVFVRADSCCILAHLTQAAFEPIVQTWPEQIDVLISHIQNARERDKIKAEALRYYGLGADQRRPSFDHGRRPSIPHATLHRGGSQDSQGSSQSDHHGSRRPSVSRELGPRVISSDRAIRGDRLPSSRRSSHASLPDLDAPVVPRQSSAACLLQVPLAGLLPSCGGGGGKVVPDKHRAKTLQELGPERSSLSVPTSRRPSDQPSVPVLSIELPEFISSMPPCTPSPKSARGERPLFERDGSPDTDVDILVQDVLSSTKSNDGVTKDEVDDRPSRPPSCASNLSRRESNASSASSAGNSWRPIAAMLARLNERRVAISNGVAAIKERDAKTLRTVQEIAKALHTHQVVMAQSLGDLKMEIVPAISKEVTRIVEENMVLVRSMQRTPTAEPPSEAASDETPQDISMVI